MPETTDTEISLSDVIMRLWAGRGIIVLVTLIAVALAALYIAMSMLATNRPVTYLINLRSIENQRYPNGTGFSPQDLLIPEVLSEVRRRLDLPANANLRSAVSVAFDSPAAAGIARSYRDQLSGRNLTQAEISEINQAYLEELRAAMRSSLRITVDYQTLGVDPELGLSIARALPEVWANVYTTQFRIFTDTRLADMAITRAEEDLLTTASTLAANARLVAMRNGLDILMEDNRLSLLQTSDGASPADVREDMRRFETVYFNPIRASSFQSGDIVAAAYLSELRLEIADMRRRTSAYDVTLAELRDYQAAAPATAMPEQPAFNDRSSLQMGESALQEVVQLAERASFATFVQETLRARNQLMFEISSLTRELEMASLAGEEGDSPAYRAQAAESLQLLTDTYSELVAAARNQLRDRSGALYEPALGPLIAGGLLPARSILILGIAGLAGGLVGIVAALGWSSIRRKRTQEAGE